MNIRALEQLSQKSRIEAPKLGQLMLKTNQQQLVSTYNGILFFIVFMYDCVISSFKNKIYPLM